MDSARSPRIPIISRANMARHPMTSAIASSSAGSSTAKWNVRFNPNGQHPTGAPFNITTGNDPYGTTLYTARPGIATDRRGPGLSRRLTACSTPTRYRAKQSSAATPGARPFQIQTNLARRTKTWSFGCGKVALPRAARRYFANRRRPPLQHVGRDVGPQSPEPQQPRPDHRQHLSPLFGQANQMAGGTQRRRLLRKRQQPQAGTPAPIHLLRCAGWWHRLHPVRVRSQSGIAAIGTRSDPTAPSPVPCTTT